MFRLFSKTVVALFFISLFSPSPVVPGQEREKIKTLRQLADNTKITESVRIAPGVYQIDDTDENGVLQIGGENITVDLRGVEIRGSSGKSQEKYSGKGIAIVKGKNILIRGGKISGFHWNIYGKDSLGIRIEGSDVSRSKAQRIYRDGQVINKWLGLRNIAAWRSYGAGIWLENCSGGKISGCRGQGAQNGLLLVASKKVKIYKNDFSFNSGWGIGLWNSMFNEVAFNRLDFVGRPWGGSVGGDSASLAVVNQSHGNWIFGNSMTHSGDGFFLTNVNDYNRGNPQGASEHNIIAYNDGSYSPHNAFEGTFSRGNYYVKNRANHSHFGFWLGFSSENYLIENTVNYNRADGIAIECARDSFIGGNTIKHNGRYGIHLWSQRPRFPSKNYSLIRNEITHCHKALHTPGNSGIYLYGNQISHVKVKADRRRPEAPPNQPLERFWKTEVGRKIEKWKSKEKLRQIYYTSSKKYPQGLMWYRWESYAPEDFRKEPLVWCKDKKGQIWLWKIDNRWQIQSKGKGFQLKKTDQERKFLLQSQLKSAWPGGKEKGKIKIEKEGKVKTIVIPIDRRIWKVRYYRLGNLKVTEKKGWRKFKKSKPHLTKRQLGLSHDWPTEKNPGRWAFWATTKYKFEGGTYEISTFSDDGVRVFVDGRMEINNWTVHGATWDRKKVSLSGVHQIDVFYFQNGGGAVFKINWKKK